MTDPVWISHRGWQQHGAVENTRAAFRAARERGFCALETDVRITSDGHLVLVHDRSLMRLAGLDLFVDRLRRAEVAGITLADGSPILSLEEFLSDFALCRVTLDIKPEEGARAVRAVAALLTALGWAERSARTRFVTWRKSDEVLLQNLLPGAECYARKRECIRALAAVLIGAGRLAGGLRPNRCYALPAAVCGRRLYRPEIVRRYQAAGARTLAFLPRGAAEHQAAVDAGVDEVLTNEAP